jgi:predicted nucleotidyltransferase
MDHAKIEISNIYLTQSMENTNNTLLFYEIMKYPVPTQRQYFVYGEKKIESNTSFTLAWPSRTDINPVVEEYVQYIKKRQRLLWSLPFIKTIYLCNSITFNHLTEQSDIDIFIVTQKKALRRARFGSAIILRILGLKRGKHQQKKKFCLSFYITEDHQNLYNISLPNTTDIYLAYWITHLVPIYEEIKWNATIYSHNTRIKSILPNTPGEQAIFLDLPCLYGKSNLKKFLEWIQKWRRGSFIEFLIRTIWLPIVISKMKWLENKWTDIIVNKYMLKFYADKRKKTSLLFKIARDKFSPSKNKDNI